jgi:hypothetical protein
MAPTTTATLVLLGEGGSLSFRDGTGAKRRVLPGIPFEVDAATAGILLDDPHVRRASAADVPRGTSEPPTGPIKLEDLAGHGGVRGQAPSGLEHNRALKARAKELGLPATGSNTDLEAAIAVEEERLAEEAAAAAAQAPSSGEREKGDQEPADDPDASATGEAGTPSPEAPAAGGAIVLGTEPQE